MEVAGNQLVHPTGNHVRHDLALARGQRFKALLELPDSLRVATPGAVTLDPLLNGIEQLLVTERLGQELDGAGLHRLHAHWYVAVAGDEYDGQMDVRPRTLA